MARTQKAQPTELPLIVEVLPGAADEGKGYLTVLGGNGYDKTIKQVLDQAVRETPKNRSLRSVHESLKTEYSDVSRITINGKPARKENIVGTYASFMTVEKTGDTEYKSLRIRVASPQEGGNLL